MQFRTFGNSGLSVSVISLGCWIFGVDWWGHRTQDDCNLLCSFSHERGVTFFDNGDAYGNGRAEELFGNWIKHAKVDRSKIQIGGKFGYDFYSDPGVPGAHTERKQDFSPKFVRFALEQSLKRLQTDYIDLYMAHNIKLPQFRDDLWPELDKLVSEGKIKTWGVSLGPAIGWREEGFKAMIDHGAKACQTVFNLFEQHPGREFCEVAISQKAGIIARVHDNSSVLKEAIKADTVIGKNDHRKFRDENWKIYGAKKVELIRKYANELGMNIHELACKWLLQQAGLTSITGTFLNEMEVQEAVNSVTKPSLLRAQILEISRDYAIDWNLGTDAHPCNLKSSVAPSGQVRSEYVPPPVLIA
ncbi:MAG: aldo/keto reductase [Burkholderiales bacterium]|nr:aldo/keto reductase [Phycisphaerae bacterium]